MSWLARKLTAQGVRYTKHDNAFVWIEDMARAQRFADRFANLKWPAILNRYAKRVTPQLQDTLRGCQHYWVSAQSEYSTDIVFKTRQDLCELYPKLLGHSTLCFGAKEVMNFLALLVQALIERELRLTMKHHGFNQLPLYPEQRNCRRPTTEQVLRLFSLAQCHRLSQAGHTVQWFDCADRPAESDPRATAHTGVGLTAPAPDLETTPDNPV